MEWLALGALFVCACSSCPTDSDGNPTCPSTRSYEPAMVGDRVILGRSNQDGYWLESFRTDGARANDRRTLGSAQVFSPTLARGGQGFLAGWSDSDGVGHVVRLDTQGVPIGEGILLPSTPAEISRIGFDGHRSSSPGWRSR